MTEENNKNCPETCPYLQGWHNFCGLFVRKLETSQDVTWRCEECLNPEQRKNTAKIGYNKPNNFPAHTLPWLNHPSRNHTMSSALLRRLHHS